METLAGSFFILFSLDQVDLHLTKIDLNSTHSTYEKRVVFGLTCVQCKEHKGPSPSYLLYLAKIGLHAAPIIYRERIIFNSTHI